MIRVLRWACALALTAVSCSGPTCPTCPDPAVPAPPAPAVAPPKDPGLVVVDSALSFDDTVTRLVAELDAQGLSIMGVVDHAANARDAGLELPPTTVVIFGNPKAGTPLMQGARTIAIDLPQKMLVWQDDAGVHLAYNDPDWLAGRHDLDGAEPVRARIAEVLAGLARAAAND
jgi:uncharacterized protein (DUF302 family)